MNKDKPIKQVLREFREKDGLKMRIFVDLMIANQGDKKQVREKLDELEGFIQKARLAGADEMMLLERSHKDWTRDEHYKDCKSGCTYCSYAEGITSGYNFAVDELIKKREAME